MKEVELKLNGMTCGSCEKVIGKIAEQEGASIKEIDAQNGFVRIYIDEGRLGVLREKLAEKGYNENTGSGARGDPGKVVGYLLSIFAGKPEVEVETTLMNYSIATTILLVFIGSIIYLLAQLGVEYIPILALSIITVVLLTAANYHMGCYRKNMNCTNGMMVGMTMGMTSGYLIGAIVGATNGMFVGSVAGMATGIGMGVAIGRYSGVMGAMEGVMAGLMSGTMGAMTSIMLFNDHLMEFLYILMGLFAIVIGGLSYMIHREAGAAKKEHLKTDFVGFATTALVSAVIIIFVILHGPRGEITYLG